MKFNKNYLVSGDEFYYDSSNHPALPVGTDPGTLGKKVDKTWIFATDEKGLVKFNKNYLVSGDEFYYDSSNHPALPVGTLVITED